MATSYELVMDPAIVKATEAIFAQMVGPLAPMLGLEWRIVIERHGRPAAAVVRTRDAGIKMHFYGDPLNPEAER